METLHTSSRSSIIIKLFPDLETKVCPRTIIREREKEEIHKSFGQYNYSYNLYYMAQMKVMGIYRG